MKILTFSNLYPNPVQLHHGVFVEQRLLRLLQGGAVQSRGVAPVAWFPFTQRVFGTYAQYAKVPEHNTRFGIEIEHPRYPVIPKVGMSLGPALMAAALLPRLKKLMRHGFDFDLIDAHYLYPDGVAAVKMAAKLGKPCVMTARGSDVNVIAEHAIPRRQIVNAAARCAAVITVSAALKEKLIAMGIDERRVHVLRNGVDLQRFVPGDRERAKNRLGLHGKVLLSVGRLVELKGHHIAIRALAGLPDFRLVIIGDGPMADQLQQIANDAGVAERVRFVSAVNHAELMNYFNAAEATVLMSSNEGMPNVLLESIASGTRVIATSVGGVPEIVRNDVVGILLAERSVAALQAAVRALDEQVIDPAATRAHAEQFGWNNTVQGLLDLFATITRGRSS